MKLADLETVLQSEYLLDINYAEFIKTAKSIDLILRFHC